MHSRLQETIDLTKMMFSPITSYLIFHVTRSCDARCKHCFYWREIAEKHHPDEMTLAEIDKFASNLSKLEIVNLCGAEPTVRKDLVEIVDIFHRRNRVRLIAIPTNGINTKKIEALAIELLENYPDITFRFSVSIDALGEMHDEFRGVKGCFEKATNTLSRLAKLKEKYSNLIVITNTTFCRHNQDTVIDVLSFLRNSFNIDSLSLTLIRGNADDQSQKDDLDMSKYREAVTYVNSYGKKDFKSHPMSKLIWTATSFARERVVQVVEKGMIDPEKREFSCYPVKRFLVLEISGEVRLCESMDVSLGNLKDYDYDIKNILALEPTKKHLEDVKNHKCNCTWECAIRTGILYNPLEYPKMAMYALAGEQHV